MSTDPIPLHERDRGKTRKSGKSAAVEAGEVQEGKFEEQQSETLPEEAPFDWSASPGFQRMKIVREGEDARQMQRVEGAIQRQVFDMFSDAFAVMNDLYEIVREPIVNQATGEVQADQYGYPVWARDPRTGAYIEDWSRLLTRQKEDFLYRITTTLFEWEQRRETLWTDAMFAKAQFTEHFSIEYDAPISGTIDDRNAVGNKKAAEDRYFALMQTSVSRRADAIVRTMNALALRLRDTLGQ